MSCIDPWKIQYETVLYELVHKKILTDEQSHRRLINRTYAKKKHEQNRKLRTALKRQLGGCCANCKDTDLRLLDFAHFKRGTKKYKRFGSILSTCGILEEYERGRFLCVWCHRLETKSELEQDVRKSIEGYMRDDYLSKDDVNAKQCIGKLCNGRYLSKSDFYKKGRRCKRCFAYALKEKIADQRYFVDSEKLRREKCAQCQMKVTKETCFCFDFDHIDHESKINSVSDMASKSIPLRILQKEMDKCQLLCCRCHRLKTLYERACADPNTII